jgi:hypothetical protein
LVYLHLHDYKSIEDYNHVVHNTCAKLRFCEKEPFNNEKIKKTPTTMLPLDNILKHQCCVRNYQRYSKLVQDPLQVEKHDELTLRNHHQCHVSMTPLP